MIKVGIKLQNLELVIRSQVSGRLRNPNRVLRWLVERGLHEDVVGLYAIKSNTKDLGQDDMTLGTSILHLAASRGWALVVHALIIKGVTRLDSLNSCFSGVRNEEHPKT